MEFLRIATAYPLIAGPVRFEAIDKPLDLAGQGGDG
jgi:hypothetical protein